MAQNFNELIVKRVVYDYTSFYKASYAQKIKLAFRDKCIKKGIYTDEYIEYISNPQNVHVEFQYGYDMIVNFSWIDVNVSYEYKDSVCTETYYSGTATVDSFGGVKVSNVQKHENYESDTFSCSRKVSLMSSGQIQYSSHIGTARYYPSEKSHYTDDLNSDTMPKDLKWLSEKKYTNEEIGEMIKDSMPENAEEGVRKWLSDIKLKSLTLLGIENYSVESIEIYFFPIAFDLWVEYKGEKYEQTYLPDIKYIAPRGEETRHYNDFQYQVKKMSNRHGVTVAKVIAFIAAMLPVLSYALIYAQIFGLPDIFGVFDDPRIFRVFPLVYLTCGGSILLTVIGIFIAKDSFDEFEEKNTAYDPKLSSIQLHNKVNSDYKKFVVGKFVGALFMLAIYGTISYFLWFF